MLSYHTPVPGGLAPSPSTSAGSYSWKHPSSSRSHLQSCLRPLTFIEPLPAADGFNGTNLCPAPACVYAFPSEASATASARGPEAKLRLCSVPVELGRARLLLAEPSPALPADPPSVSPSHFCCSDSSLLGGGAAGLPNLAILGLFLKAPAAEMVGRPEAHRLSGGFCFFKECLIRLPAHSKPGTGAHGRAQGARGPGGEQRAGTQPRRAGANPVSPPYPGTPRAARASPAHPALSLPSSSKAPFPSLQAGCEGQSPPASPCGAAPSPQGHWQTAHTRAVSAFPPGSYFRHGPSIRGMDAPPAGTQGASRWGQASPQHPTTGSVG